MSGSDDESSSASTPAPQASNIAEDISQILRNPKYGKGSDTKSKKKKGTTKSEGSEEQTDTDALLEPLLAAARWIPLAIDPFISLRDVFIAGINGRSGQREAMNDEEQYQCIVFEQIVPLVPNFISILSEVRKNPQTFENFVYTLGKVAGSARSSDVHGFKTFMYKYIAPNEESKSRYLIPDASKKTMWGWHNTVTARYLCPMRLISKFDENPDLFREDVQAGRRMIKASSFPMFLYDTSKYDPNNMYSGLFQGHLLVKFYRHVFTSPSSWDKGIRNGGKPARGIANGLKAPTPRTIAYIAMMLRWALSSLTKFEEKDQDFCLVEFYRSILLTFNERMDFSNVYELNEDDAEWVDSTLRWWQGMVPALKRGVINHDNQDPEEEESDLFRLRAARKTKAEVDDSLIDPHLEHPSGSLSIPQQSLPPQATLPMAQIAPAYVNFTSTGPSAPPSAASTSLHQVLGAPPPAATATFFHQAPGASLPGAATTAFPQVPITDISNTQDTAQTPGPDASHARALANKRANSAALAEDPLDNTVFSGDLTPQHSPAPKRLKPAPAETASLNAKVAQEKTGKANRTGTEKMAKAKTAENSVKPTRTLRQSTRKKY